MMTLSINKPHEQQGIYLKYILIVSPLSSEQQQYLLHVLVSIWQTPSEVNRGVRQ